jgi:hypothetical protein
MVSSDSSLNTGYRVKLTFQIGLHKKDGVLLELIKSFFGVGHITKLDFRSTQFRVSYIEGLKVIISHLDKYPLLTNKSVDFELFKEVFKLMLEGKHLTIDGLKKIVSIKTVLNKGLSDKLKNAFPNPNIIVRPQAKQSNVQIYDLN